MQEQRDRETLDELVDQLVAAIELRECGDPDGWDWTVDRNIRLLERMLLERHRHAAGRGEGRCSPEPVRHIGGPIAAGAPRL